MRRLNELSPSKQALLAKWARTGAGSDSGIPLASPGAGPMPLSFVQERQLFLELLDPLTAVNNLAVCVRLNGPLDVAALEGSANRIIARHETLRTSFDLSQGRAIPRLSLAVTIALGIVDLEKHRADRQVEAVRLAELEARRPFDLGRAPLLRAKVLRLGAEEHVLVIVIHHTIADAFADSFKKST